MRLTAQNVLSSETHQAGGCLTWCHTVSVITDDEAESLLPTRRSSRIIQRRHHVSEPLPGVPTHLPAGTYMASQALALPPLSMPSASGAHPCEASSRIAVTLPFWQAVPTIPCHSFEHAVSQHCRVFTFCLCRAFWCV